MQLAFHGPFGATSRCPGASLCDATVGYSVGVCLWAVELPGRYRVAYLGKTHGKTRNFVIRIGEETERFLRGLDGFFDPKLFKQGLREPISRPTDGGHDILWQLIECSPVFVAPLDCDAHLVRVVESALIRKLQSFSADTRQFLIHGGRLLREKLSEPVRVYPPTGVVFEGMDGEMR